MMKTLDQINREFMTEYMLGRFRFDRKNGVSLSRRYIALCGILILLFVAVFAYGAGTKNKNGFFGFSVYEVLTESMQSEIPKGSLILIKHIDPAFVRVGDDITFIQDCKTRMTHRVIKVIENHDGTGRSGFETKGTDNPIPDEQIVDAGSLLGKVVWHIKDPTGILPFIHGSGYVIVLFVIGSAGAVIFMKHVLSRKRNKKTCKVLSSF